MRKMKFVIKRADNDEFYFVLVAKNNQVLMTSECYTRKQAAKKAIKAIQDAFFLYRILDVEDKS